ncbi:MAG: Dam family site-specific DNA-(adenine-N6)-methyltransferase [Mesorhizobium sp.]|nr:MAG: Dam family site-specific DNA-(adenine-N6)-methyltransferase [Mesorhizobium sp.]
MHNEENSEPITLSPFLKWAGGKRWFAERWLHLIPKQFERYIEPFVGSGAMYFSLLPESAILSDLNADLINAYCAVRDDPASIQQLLQFHDDNHSKDHYYLTRAAKPEDTIKRAGRLIYLNRTCWNGLYRVNRRNEFNVPIGTKTRVVLPTDNFPSVSAALRNAQLLVQDFEATIDLAGDGDFVFVDPPYTVKHNFNGFVKYNDHIFSWADQVRLRDAVARASDRGAMLLVTNANHQSIREIYQEIGECIVLKRASILAASSTHRSQVEELAIRTWVE